MTLMRVGSAVRDPGVQRDAAIPALHHHRSRRPGEAHPHGAVIEWATKALLPALNEG